jgi:hypothetical protein
MFLEDFFFKLLTSLLHFLEIMYFENLLIPGHFGWPVFVCTVLIEEYVIRFFVFSEAGILSDFVPFFLMYILVAIYPAQDLSGIQECRNE